MLPSRSRKARHVGSAVQRVGHHPHHGRVPAQRFWLAQDELVAQSPFVLHCEADGLPHGHFDAIGRESHVIASHGDGSGHLAWIARLANATRADRSAADAHLPLRSLTNRQVEVVVIVFFDLLTAEGGAQELKRRSSASPRSIQNAVSIRSAPAAVQVRCGWPVRKSDARTAPSAPAVSLRRRRNDRHHRAWVYPQG